MQTQTNHLKVFSFNIHKGNSWILRKSTIAKMREKLRQLSPDIILLQESFGSQSEYLAEEIWPFHSYGKNAIYARGHHGNAILSKYPILFSQNTDISMGAYESRGFLHTVMEYPNQHKPIHIFCVHLGLFTKDREKQLKRIIHYIKSLPEDESFVLGGDFNDWQSHATKMLVHELNWQEAFLQHHGAYAKTFPARVPLLKLDRIYTRGFETHQAERLTHPTWKPLSDHVALNVTLEPTSSIITSR